MDTLPRELLSEVLKKVSLTAERPGDLCAAACVSKAFQKGVEDRDVLRAAGSGTLSVRLRHQEAALSFLKRLACSGSLDAQYMRGMLHFYALLEFGIGGDLIARAARENHGPALFQCAICLLNGSGGDRLDKDDEGANELLFRAASLGYRPAAIELANRIRRGLGTEGNKELGATVLRLAKAGKYGQLRDCLHGVIRKDSYPTSTSFLPAIHVVDWSRKSLPDEVSESKQLAWRELARATHTTVLKNTWKRDTFACANFTCGRISKKKTEFRRCQACFISQYCSILCQGMDRKRHKGQECGLGLWA